MNMFRQISSFSRRSTLSFCLRFGGLLLQFTGAILIARVLGAEGYGIYTYAFTVAIVTGSFLGFGYVPLAVRELPRHLSLQEYGLAWGFLVSGFWLIVLSGTLAAIVLKLLIWAGIVVLAISWPLVALAAVLQALILGLASTMNGFQRVIQSQFIETVIRQGIFLAAICGFGLWGYRLTPTSLFLLALMIAFLVLVLLVWRVGKAITTETSQSHHTHAYDLRRWLIAGLPLMGVAVLTQIQMNLDVLMIGAVSDNADVGRYRAAARGAEMVVIANGIALQLLEPMLSRAITLGDKAEAQRLVSHSVMVSVSLSVALALPLFIGASFYLGLFGTEFVLASPVLQLLVCGYVLGFLCGPVAVILVMSGREHVVFVVTLIGLAINLGINLVFIPRYGILAAAVATFVSGVLTKLILLVVVLRSTTFDPTPGALFHRVQRRHQG